MPSFGATSANTPLSPDSIVKPPGPSDALQPSSFSEKALYSAGMPLLLWNHTKPVMAISVVRVWMTHLVQRRRSTVPFPDRSVRPSCRAPTRAPAPDTRSVNDRRLPPYVHARVLIDIRCM